MDDDVPALKSGGCDLQHRVHGSLSSAVTQIPRKRGSTVTVGPVELQFECPARGGRLTERYVGGSGRAKTLAAPVRAQACGGKRAWSGVARRRELRGTDRRVHVNLDRAVWTSPTGET